MSYDKGYEKTEIDASLLSEAQRIIIDGFMLEGEFNFREKLIKVLEEEIAKESNDFSTDWSDGISYCIHLVKNLKPETN